MLIVGTGKLCDKMNEKSETFLILSLPLFIPASVSSIVFYLLLYFYVLSFAKGLFCF